VAKDKVLHGGQPANKVLKVLGELEYLEQLE
jgi:hypothetical protein